MAVIMFRLQFVGNSRRVIHLNNDAKAQVTLLLSAVCAGDSSAADRLMRLVYDELHRIAHALMAREDRRGG
ncbi:MAG: hypothetical protein HY269_06195, partial [Deltaproteobacteria bacterium]|nr:hypothetical protein [Deltaproteobacteria bacterium]